MIILRRRGATPGQVAGLRRGDTIAGYRIERGLGSGGMGAVYEATQLSLKRSVALKVIAPGLPLNETLRERFRREGQLQAIIEHPHILPVYEAGESDGRLFIAMRLVHGPTLKTLAVARALDYRRSVQILSDVAHALDAAHEAGLVHRDVKPQNILLDPGDFAYLADFGLSKTPGDPTLTHSGELLGSVAYMSPEQARGEHAAEASDIYSFTCVVYECMVGLVPFPRESDHAVLHAHIWDPPPRPSEIRAELPAALDEVIAGGMAKAPDTRPPSACALVRDARLALGLPAESADDDVPAAYVFGRDGSSTDLDSPLASRGGRRGGRILQAIAAVVAVLVGISAGYLISPDPVPAPPPKPPDAGNGHSIPPDGGRFARDLNAIFGTLRRGTQTVEHRLKEAKTARAQAAALAGLAAAYRTAGTAVEHARAPAAARDARHLIAGALDLISGGYRKLALAARQRDRRRYDDAVLALRRSERGTIHAFTRLRAAGYRVR
jgi:serine/threonine-protein kinase